jgi:hypothetical protein
MADKRKIAFGTGGAAAGLGLGYGAYRYGRRIGGAIGRRYTAARFKLTKKRRLNRQARKAFMPTGAKTPGRFSRMWGAVRRGRGRIRGSGKRFKKMFRVQRQFFKQGRFKALRAAARYAL